LVALVFSASCAINNSQLLLKGNPETNLSSKRIHSLVGKYIL
jgi:hypothetical protein